MTRDFGNSIVRCAMSKRLFKLFSIYIYQTKFSFLFLFLQRHFYLSKRDYFVSSNTGPCIILNDWKIDEEVRQLAARQPLSMLRFSFLRIVRSTYDESRFDRIEKTTRLFERRSTTESPKSEKKKEGRSDDGEVKKKWSGEKNRGKVRGRREEEILWMPQKLRISVSRRIEK